MLCPSSPIPTFPLSHPSPCPPGSPPPDSAHPTALAFIFHINCFTFRGCKGVSQRLTPPRGCLPPFFLWVGVPKSPPVRGDKPCVTGGFGGGRSLISRSASLSWGVRRGVGGGFAPKGAPPRVGTRWGHQRGLGGSVPGADLQRRGWEKGLWVWGELRDGEGTWGPHPQNQPGSEEWARAGGPTPPRTPWAREGARAGGPTPSRPAPGLGRGAWGRGSESAELGLGVGGVGVPHPQGCPDGGQLEEDPLPLLGTHIPQLGRAHLQQLMARQHPQGPHRAGGGTGVSRARLHPRMDPRGFW